MRYLCLAYYDEKKFETLSAADLEAIGRECRPHDEALRATGRLVTVASLESVRTAATVRPRAGKTTITDGPFTETKEQVGAFFIIEAEDRNEAILLASKHPAAQLGEELGWGIEVRAIETFDAPERGVSR